MDKFWIISLILSTAHKMNGQSDVQVNLIAKKYVEKGTSVTLFCEHNVASDILYKVAFLKSSNHKFFEYINGRIPPFRNFSVPGAEIDFFRSNKSQVTLKVLDFDAAGMYYCEVSTDTPIFTKASNEEQIHVFLPQTGPPRIAFKKRQFFFGENLIANCTTTRARPPPHITWLINGKKVEEIYTRTLHPYGSSSGKNIHRKNPHQHSFQQLQQQHNQLEQDRPKHVMTDVYSVVRSGGMRIQKGNLEKDNSPYEIFSSNFNNNNRNNHYSMSSHHKTSQHYENTEHIPDNFNHNTNHNNNINKNNNNRESNVDFYDNKYYDMYKKHRNAFSRKNRRHINEGQRSSANSGSMERPIERVNHRGTFAASQLNIEVSELHADANGRLEITCLATIPAQISPGEQYADYKTYSVKIDVEAAEITTQAPLLVAAFGNSSDKLFPINYTLTIFSQCLPLIFLLNFYYRCQI